MRQEEKRRARNVKHHFFLHCDKDVRSFNNDELPLSVNGVEFRKLAKSLL